MPGLQVFLRLLLCMFLLFLVLLPEVTSRSRDRMKKFEHRKSCDFRWSAWSDFSLCSRSCGLGIKSRHRTCYEYGPDPRPVSGKNCKGKTQDHQACNAQPCPPGSRDFRDLQCSFLKGQTEPKGNFYRWKVFSQGFRARENTDPCIATCSGEKRRGVLVKFVDGTQCGANPHSVCVAGICVPIGCDSRPYSNKSVDRCGVCGGTNRTCHTVSRRISHRIPTGYTELLRIPEGARYIKVTERPRSDVILTLKNVQGTSSIKGERSGGHKTDTKLMAGTVVYYYHPSIGLENIRAEGPLNESVLVTGFARSPSVVSLWYEYTIANSKTPVQPQGKALDSNIPHPSYHWESILYDQVMSMKGLSGVPAMHPDAPTTAVPSCHRHTRRRKENHGSRHRKRTGARHHSERFQIFKIKNPMKGPGRRKSSHSRRKNEGTRKHSTMLNTRRTPNVIYSSGTFRNDSIVSGKVKTYESFKTITNQNLGLKMTTKLPQSVPKKPKSIVKSQRTRSNDKKKEGFSSRPKTIPHFPLPSAHSARAEHHGRSQVGNITQGRNQQSETRFILYVRTTSSPSPGPKDKSAMNSSQSERKPVEQPKPTFMPSEKNKKSIEDLSMSRGREPEEEEDEEDEEEESPDLKVDLSVQVAARKSQKAEKRRRGRDRGRRRKKEDRNKRKFRWQANPVSPCTSTCQMGTTVTMFSCYQHSGERVDDKFCDAETKPPPSHHSCATKTCRPRWVAGLWSECSESCGEGTQTRTARCWQMMAPGFDSTVRDFTCNPDEKPQTTRTCHKLHSCIPQWEMSSWEECSTECGYGVQLRHVRCSAESEAVCSTRKRPPDKRPCRNKPCINQWYTLPWSSCSGMCGIRKRKVYCRDKQGRVVEDRKCDFNSKPLTVHACGRCKNKWVPQEWGECSVTCGGGVTTRRVVCGTTRGGKFHVRPDSFCVKEVRPPTTTTCRTAPCGATWYTTEWTECSESCGQGGQRYREVRCYGGTAEELCDVKRKPEERVQCELPPCETRQLCEDDGETRCDLVVTAKLCSHVYYRKACCKTCSPYT